MFKTEPWQTSRRRRCFSHLCPAPHGLRWEPTGPSADTAPRAPQLGPQLGSPKWQNPSTPSHSLPDRSNAQDLRFVPVTPKRRTTANLNVF